MIPQKLKLISLMPLVAVCFALAPPAVQAAGVSPAPDGGYPNGTTAEGDFSLSSLTTGANNTALGFGALNGTADGDSNTGVGNGALFFNASGAFNTATGVQALFRNTSGFNTADGYVALFNNTSGFGNTAQGFAAMNDNGFGSLNVASGFGSLFSNTTGNGNVGVGPFALFSSTTAGDNDPTNDGANTAVGFRALQDVISAGPGALTDGGNVAVGWLALAHAAGTAGFPADDNTAVGSFTLVSNTNGTVNTALGRRALEDVTSGGFNTGLGWRSCDNVSDATGVTCIGSHLTSAGFPVAGVNVSDTTYIGNVRGVTTGLSAIPVVIDTNGQLGTASSSARFKKDIKPMDKASDAILALKPVTFHYKQGDGGQLEFGLIAEEVAKVNPDLIARDAKGEIYSVRYDAVNAMLLNEFLKEHRKVEEQAATIAQLKSGMDALVATVKEQGSQIQKVTAQVELNKAAPQAVANK